MKPYITHLILSGGGMKGFCYTGIMRYFYMEKLMDNLKYIAGTSIGSYFTVLFALKVSIEEVETIMYDIAKDINKHKFKLSIENIENAFINKGIFDISILSDSLRNILKDKCGDENITFLDFIKHTGINVYIDSLCVNDGKSVVFSAETTPYVKILDAVSASMSVSFLFKPILINNKYHVDNVITDKLSIDNIFCDIPSEHKLYIHITQTDYEKVQIVEPNTRFSFFQFVKRVILITFKSIIISKQIYDRYDVLDITDIPCKSAFNLVIKNNEIQTILDKDDIENLILKGFSDITYYINNRYKNKLEDIY